MRKTLAAVAAFSAVCSLVPSAQASGLLTARFGGEAGTPLTSNPTALYWNPAGMGASRGTHLYVDGLFAYRSFSYEHAKDPDEPAGSNGEVNQGTSSFGIFLAAPTLGVTTQLDLGNGPRAAALVLGAGLFAPFGGSAKIERESKGDPLYPGAIDGPGRWQNIEGETIGLYLSSGAAIDLPLAGDSADFAKRLRIGLSFSGVRTSVRTIRAKTGSFNADPAYEGRSILDVSGWHGAIGTGVQLQLGAFTLATSYQSQPGFGEQRLNGTAVNAFSQTDLQKKPSTSVDLIQTLPDVMRFGVGWRASERVELRLFGDYTRWSVFKTQCVVREGEPCNLDLDTGAAKPGPSSPITADMRRWKDAFGLRAGGSYFLDGEGRRELMFGLGWDGNAVPDSTLDSGEFDGDDLTAAVGTRLRISDSLYLGGTYTFYYTLPRDNTGKSIYTTLQSPSRAPDAGGKYTQNVHFLNVNLELVL